MSHRKLNKNIPPQVDLKKSKIDIEQLINDAAKPTLLPRASSSEEHRRRQFFSDISRQSSPTDPRQVQISKISPLQSPLPPQFLDTRLKTQQQELKPQIAAVQQVNEQQQQSQHVISSLLSLAGVMDVQVQQSLELVQQNASAQEESSYKPSFYVHLMSCKHLSRQEGGQSSSDLFDIKRKLVDFYSQPLPLMQFTSSLSHPTQISIAIQGSSVQVKINNNDFFLKISSSTVLRQYFIMILVVLGIVDNDQVVFTTSNQTLKKTFQSLFLWIERGLLLNTKYRSSDLDDVILPVLQMLSQKQFDVKVDKRLKFEQPRFQPVEYFDRLNFSFCDFAHIQRPKPVKSGEVRTGNQQDENEEQKGKETAAEEHDTSEMDSVYSATFLPKAEDAFLCLSESQRQRIVAKMKKRNQISAPDLQQTVKQTSGDLEQTAKYRTEKMPLVRKTDAVCVSKAKLIGLSQQNELIVQAETVTQEAAAKFIPDEISQLEAIIPKERTQICKTHDLQLRFKLQLAQNKMNELLKLISNVPDDLVLTEQFSLNNAKK